MQIIRQLRDPKTGSPEYVLTEAGEELRPVIMSLGNWGQKWIESNLSLRNLDPTLLMWDMRRHLDPTPLPKRRVTVRFTFPDATEHLRDHWLVVEPSGATDLCHIDPGHDVDLFVSGSLRSMTAVWMGKAKLREYGIAPPHRVAHSGNVVQFASRPPSADVVACPRCGSTHTMESARFGSTACKALYKCLACKEPFDYFKPY